MTSPEARTNVLAVPRAAPAKFGRNFIKLAVCEFRFATLFSLEDSPPPTSFATAMRRDYPNYEAIRNVALDTGKLVASGHSFHASRNLWKVSLRASAVSIETEKYVGFADFSQRASAVVRAVTPIIDTSSFTRIGLRFINLIPCTDLSEISEWLNPALVSDFVQDSWSLGAITEYTSQFRGMTERGGYSIRHGLASGQTGYALDIDLYAEDVSVEDASEMVSWLHEQEFSLFMWALGDRSRKYLGPSILRKK